MGKPEASPAFGLRMLIILYSVGIVAIGYHPLRHDAKRMVAQMRSVYRELLSLKPDTSWIRKKIEDPKGESSKPVERAEIIIGDGDNIKGLLPAPKKLDHITNKDKKELDGLLQELKP